MSRPRALFLVFLPLLSLAAPALADNPYDVEQRRLGRAAAAERGPRGIVPLLELWSNWDESTPAVTLAEIERVAASRRLPVARRAYAQALRARALLRMGDQEAAREAIDSLGYVREWQVVGPFDNEGKRGLAQVFGPEEQRAGAFVAGNMYTGKEREVSWRRYPDVAHHGYVNFDSLFRPYANVCGYATTTVNSESAQPLALWVGAGGAAKVWWNGEEVYADPAYRFPDADRAVVAVGAHRGANRLLVKTCVTDTTWGFFLRVTDGAGAAPRGVTVDAEAMPDAAGVGNGPRVGRPLEAHLAPLEAAAAGDSPSARALFDLARFLGATGADDPAEGRVRQLAARAADIEPRVEYLELAARSADQRADTNRYVQRAIEIAPNDPEVLILQAQVERSGLHAEDALPILDRIPNSGVTGMQARTLRAELLADMDLFHAARALFDEVGALAEGAPGWTRLRADAAIAAGDRDAGIDLRRRALVGRWDDGGSRRVLIADAVRRRDVPMALEHLEAIRAIAPDESKNLTYVAAIYEALGRTDEALETFRAARELAPEDAETIVAHGELLLRLDQPDAATDALRLAMELRPQDAETRELLEQIEPQERADEAYAADTATLLARRVENAGFPLTTLQDLTVNTVFDNGLGSSFRQVAMQVHDEEGARQMRSYSVQFDPGSQRLDVRLARIHRGGEVLEATQTFEQQLGEPWYRIYYDTRARVIVFPDLEPGDVIELRWRVDDVAHRNLFADYYGDLTFLQSFSPIRHEEYVLITPSAREFFFNEPRLRSLRHTREEGEGRRVDRFVADDVPALRSEPDMPGMTEVAPYLHVSTYRTWDDVGHWYWGLIQDQLYADEELKQTVRELVAGKTELRDKVIAIHDWVVENTRYVGLEFGIHGYKPYRVPQIVRRGFGDCKDKASLLFTMFREAGIDAHIVLTRTRRNGNITDLPASLAVFDHAIAYVPGLDLYIDGTAEQSGVTELPGMDQGVTVLHVWPEGAELRRTPVLPPDRNQRDRELDIRLARDGSATVQSSEVITGGQAPGYRNTYQAEGTRNERLERALRGLFPGLRLESQSFENLDTLERPVRYRYTAEVPQLAQRDGDSLRLGASVLDDLTRAMARQPSRRYPLDLGELTTYTEERTVHLPQGMRATQVPRGGVAESPFGRLSVSIESSARQVQARTEFELRRDVVSPEDYPAFRQWVTEADQILRQQLRVEP